MRWPFSRKPMPPLIVVPGDEVVRAASMLSRHRAEAQRQLIRETTRQLRAELKLPAWEDRP